MRVSRALAVTATAFAAVGLSAPMAAATNGPVNVAVNPQAVHQGGTLKITAQGCGHGGKVWSNAFPTTTLSPGDGTNFAHARVRNNTTPGQYHLSVKCSDNDRIATQKFTVLMRQRRAGRARRLDGSELRGDAGRRRSGGRGGRRRRGLPRPAPHGRAMRRSKASNLPPGPIRPSPRVLDQDPGRLSCAACSRSVAAVGGAAAREVEGARGRRGHQSRSGSNLHRVGGA